jgi:hypothetical protein
MQTPCMHACAQTDAAVCVRVCMSTDRSPRCMHAYGRRGSRDFPFLGGRDVPQSQQATAARSVGAARASRNRPLLVAMKLAKPSVVAQRVYEASRQARTRRKTERQVDQKFRMISALGRRGSGRSPKYAAFAARGPRLGIYAYFMSASLSFSAFFFDGRTLFLALL